MAIIIDFTAKVNERRAAAEISRREQAVAETIGGHMDAARNAAAQGDAKAVMTHVAKAADVQERAERLCPAAYCDPSNERRGVKYEATSKLSVTELPALMRQDIKNAFVRGLLPKGLKVSVRRTSCTYSWSIDVTITALPASVPHWDPELHEDNWGMPFRQYSAELQRCLDVLKSIHGAYQRDNSDTMTDYFDVRYYGGVSVDWRLGH